MVKDYYKNISLEPKGLFFLFQLGLMSSDLLEQDQRPPHPGDPNDMQLLW